MRELQRVTGIECDGATLHFGWQEPLRDAEDYERVMHYRGIDCSEMVIFHLKPRLKRKVSSDFSRTCLRPLSSCWSKIKSIWD